MVPRCQAQDDLAREPPRRREIHMLERGGVAQLGLWQPLREPPLLAGRPFGLDQQAEAVSKLSAACRRELCCSSNAAAIAKDPRNGWS